MALGKSVMKANRFARCLLVAVTHFALAACVSGCSTSPPKLGLDTASPPGDNKEMDGPEEERRVREMQSIRIRYEFSPSGDPILGESDGSAEETAEWAALVCGGRNALVHYQFSQGWGTPELEETWSEAQRVELRLCMARAYARMAQSARGPILVELDETNGVKRILNIPVQAGGARVVLLARALEYALYAWEMSKSDLEEYLLNTPRSFESGGEYHPASYEGPRTVEDPEATEQARLLGPLMREAYDRYLEYNDLLIEQIMAVSDAELASTASTSLAAYRSVERDVLSRSWAAHLLVGGDPGLPGLTSAKVCSTPALSPQAQRAIDVFRRAAPKPGDILGTLSITELLNSPSEQLGSVRRRLVTLFDESIPNSVEERFQLRTQDFIEARQYLQDELRVFSRNQDRTVHGSDPSLPRYAAVAYPPKTDAAYWAAVARSASQGNDLRQYLGQQLLIFLNESKRLLKETEAAERGDRDAIFGPIASVVSDAQEQVLGEMLQIGEGWAVVWLTHEANAKLKKVRFVRGEAGLSCALRGVIEGEPCTAAEFSTLSRGIVEARPHDYLYYYYTTDDDFAAGDDRIYVVHSPDGSEEPGHFRALGGAGPRAGFTDPLTPGLDERVASLLAPNEKWCTQQKVGCAEGANRFNFDERLPLENDLASDGDPVESSWRYYLDKAKEAASDADALGEAYILANLDADNRKETIEMREEARRAEAEEALSRLQTTCGTDVDPIALFGLLVNGDANTTDLSALREAGSCSADTDCRGGFRCLANSCIIDIQAYLDKHAVELDPKLTEGLHRLSECIGTTTTVPFISLGNKPLCVYYLDTPSQLCQTAANDTATACPAAAIVPSTSGAEPHCTPCKTTTDKNCFQVPLGANNARYKTAVIKNEDLLNFFDTDSSQLNLTPRTSCNFLSDALRWDPQALHLDIDGVATQSPVTSETVAYWVKQIRASGLFHPAGELKDIIRRIGFYSSFGATTGSGITLDNEARYTPSTKGSLWWYTDDAFGLRAVTALKLSLPEIWDPFTNVSFPYYVVELGADAVSSKARPSFLWGGIPHVATDTLAFTDSTQKRRYLNGGEEVCDDTWWPWDAEGCFTEHGSPSFLYTSVSSTGQTPNTWWGYGTEPGQLATSSATLHMAIGTWPKNAEIGRPKSAWWWNGFSFAAPVADPDETKCSDTNPDACKDVLSLSLLARRDLTLANPFKRGSFTVGNVYIQPREALKATPITTADLLRGAHLMCELVDYERSFRCDPQNPPAVNSVKDLALVRQAMECTGKMIEGRAALSVFSQFPERARNALRQQGVVGAFPQVGGEIGQLTSQIANSLVSIKQAVADVAVEVKLIGLSLDQLRTDEALRDVRDKIVNINFKSSVANLITGCLKAAASSVGVDSVVNPGAAVAAAVECANSVVQIDLAGKLQTAQKDENQLVYLSALNALRENLATRAGNMQRLRSQLLTDMNNLDGQLASLETTRYEARRQLSRALYKASSQAKSEPALTNVYANRATLSEKRYQSAHQRAVKLAFLARRAIEMRLGVDLSTLTEAYPLVEAPATWATTLCSTTGVDYDKLRKNSDEFSALAPSAMQDQFIGTYVRKLEDFVEAYRLQHSFKEGRDVVVASLRDDVLGVKATCSVESVNQIRDTSHLDLAWAPAGCTSNAACIRVAAGGADGAPAYAPQDSELRAASPIGVYLGNEDGTACVAPGCGYKVGAGLIRKVFPRGNLFPNTYVLSWYHPASDTLGPTLMEALTDDLQPLSDTSSGTVSTSQVVGWKRSYVTFKLDKPMTVTLRIGAKVDATAAGKHFYLAAPMLEQASGANPLPSAFQGADEEGKRLDAVCSDTGGANFRNQNWRRDCVKLCGDGFGSHCVDANASTSCYRELSFWLSQRDIELGRALAVSGFAQGNYNYRIEDVGVNLVGTALHDCADPTAPESCYGLANVQYSLVHSGPYLVRNHMGNDYDAKLFTGKIEHARALAAERYLTNPMSSNDRDLLQTFMRGEFAGRPVDGRYALRIWESPSFDFNAIEDVQLVMNYRYWTRN